jgi:hypothetical protein
MKLSIPVILASIAAPVFFSLGGCSLVTRDVEYDRHAYYYPDRYQRDYYRSSYYRAPVVVAPRYVAPAPRYIPPHDHTVIVRPDGRRVYVRDY